MLCVKDGFLEMNTYIPSPPFIYQYVGKEKAHGSIIPKFPGYGKLRLHVQPTAMFFCLMLDISMDNLYSL